MGESVVGDRDQYHQVLMRGRWYSELAADKQQRLLDFGAFKVVPAGTPLFMGGDEATGLFAVLEGVVRVSGVRSRSRGSMLALVRPPLWFGELPFFDDCPRLLDVATLTEVRLLVVGRAHLAQWLNEDPTWWRCLGQLMAEKVRALFDGLEDATSLPALESVARRVWSMTVGYGMLREGQTDLELPVSQEELGAMLGLTRQTVSKVLATLSAHGVIRRRYGVIEVLDLAGLRRCAEAGLPDAPT